MRCIVLTSLAFALLAAPARAEDPKPKPTVELSGSIDDESLQKAMPASSIVASQKGWEKLAKDWRIKDAPKVDFEKEILIVGTWRGSQFNITPIVKDGDLTIAAGGTKDLRPASAGKCSR